MAVLINVLHYEWSLYVNYFLSFVLNKRPFLRGIIFLMRAHTKCLAKKGAFIPSTVVFLKILGNILKKYVLFRLEHTKEWKYTPFFGEDGIQQNFSSNDPSSS